MAGTLGSCVHQCIAIQLQHRNGAVSLRVSAGGGCCWASPRSCFRRVVIEVDSARGRVHRLSPARRQGGGHSDTRSRHGGERGTVLPRRPRRSPRRATSTSRGPCAKSLAQAQGCSRWWNAACASTSCATAPSGRHVGDQHKQSRMRTRPARLRVRHLTPTLALLPPGAGGMRPHVLRHLPDPALAELAAARAAAPRPGGGALPRVSGARPTLCPRLHALAARQPGGLAPAGACLAQLLPQGFKAPPPAPLRTPP